MSTSDTDIIIVGGGLAGLSCALQLHKAGIAFVLLEAGAALGGRVQTEHRDGYLLDHGFQVLQTAYPEARRQLDLDALQLKTFAPGAMVRYRNRFHTLADPLRCAKHLLPTLSAPVGTLKDRLRILALRRSVKREPPDRLFEEAETTAMDYLKSYGFSNTFIQRFFVPFFGGVFLDPTLSASSRVFRYIFRMFSEGHAALPSLGMGAIPRQLADRLPGDALRTRSSAVRIDGTAVCLESGERLSARCVVIATPAPETRRLLGVRETRQSHGEFCLYFSMDAAPVQEPFLVLNGDGSGPVNNIAFPSMVCPRYAPTGKSLMSVVVLSGAAPEPSGLTKAVRNQLIQWFGRQAETWHHLKTFHIAHALPDQQPPSFNPFGKIHTPMPGVYVCGEYGGLPGIQWALRSGRMAARAVMASLV